MASFFVIFFCCCVLFSAMGVIFSKNPINSVLWLILCFCYATAILLLFGLEFLGMLFLMVYIGAIAVLFLFVVMMLDTGTVELSYLKSKYFPVGIVFVLFFSFELFFVYDSFFSNSVYYFNRQLVWLDWSQLVVSFSHVEIFGLLLYNENVDLFLFAGVLLLVSMVGAIVLTFQTKNLVKRQVIYRQTFRNFEKTIKRVR